MQDQRDGHGFTEFDDEGVVEGGGSTGHGMGTADGHGERVDACSGDESAGLVRVRSDAWGVSAAFAADGAEFSLDVYIARMRPVRGPPGGCDVVGVVQL